MTFTDAYNFDPLKVKSWEEIDEFENYCLNNSNIENWQTKKSISYDVMSERDDKAKAAKATASKTKVMQDDIYFSVAEQKTTIQNINIRELTTANIKDYINTDSDYQTLVRRLNATNYNATQKRVLYFEAQDILAEKKKAQEAAKARQALKQ